MINMFHHCINTLKRTIKSLLLQVGLWVVRKQQLKRLVINILGYMPRLSYRLRRILIPTTTSCFSGRIISYTPSDLSPRAMKIYIELKQAIAAEKN
jgi:hypothetical protein